ncbi:phosphoribosylglycinamide formyltransferase [Rubrivirga sp. IMCC43871]|uniref:phosphoribosylglycinamide formyltransferase n=1 Tax=Rubrivirga sp. IMCC43871 TaxID=3391575 RepID=UPI00398FFD2B
MRLAVFASGSGSNAAAIWDAIAHGAIAAESVLLLTDRPGIGALARAEARGIPTEVIAPLGDEAVFAQSLLDALARAEADTIALAGYLRKIPEPVVWAFRHRILNVHPALLPAFGGPGMYGAHVHRAVIDYGCRLSGATVHLVDAEFDTGPVILQEAVPVEPDDTPATLAARVLGVEHRLFPRALALLAAGRLRVDGRHVRILPGPPDPAIPPPSPHS